jgi:aldehyde dehydrogenase (NAD+)
MRIAREEIFGPVVSVIPCRSLEEAIDIGNNVDYGLSASIYTQDINRSLAAMRDLRNRSYGRTRRPSAPKCTLPFGGTKNTGNAIARRARPRSMCFRNGSPSTSTSAVNCSARR